jgi:hypothetical protein
LWLGSAESVGVADVSLGAGWAESPAVGSGLPGGMCDEVGEGGAVGAVGVGIGG